MRRRWIAGAAAIAAVTILLSVGTPRHIAANAWRAATGRPRLQVYRHDDLFVVDVQTLGEYQTTVAAMRLSRGREVVWEARAADGAPQLHTFRLRVGSNPTIPQECDAGPPPLSCDEPRPIDGYAVTPPPSSSFELERGVQYRLEVWGSDSWWSRASAILKP